LIASFSLLALSGSTTRPIPDSLTVFATAATSLAITYHAEACCSTD
jgi:hypothetical protein